MRDKRGARFVLRYTAMFACVAAAVAAVFALYGKSFIFGKDGAAQHAPALMYLGEYIRDGLSGNGWKMVDFSLGQGLDVLSTLTYYSFTEPLALLSAAFMPQQIELAYGLLLFLRLYLAGMFACLLAKRWGAEAWTVPISGVMYAFCGFALGGGMKHLNFGVGIMCLPLLLLGIERYFAKKKWGLYVFAVALQLISNFYFAYMNTVIAVLYIIVRLVLRLSAKEQVAECAKDGFVLLGGYLLGAAVSAAVMLPVAMAYLGSSRPVDASAANALVYPMEYYAQVFATLFQYPTEVGYWAGLGFVPPAFFGLALLFGKGRKENGAVCIMLTVCFVMLCCPLAGRVMNGMGYVSNRWSYALALFVAGGTAIGLKYISECRSGWMTALCAAAVVYAVVSAWILETVNAMAASMMFGAVALVVLLCSKNFFGWLSEKRKRRLIALMAAVSVMAYTVLFFVPRGEGMISAYWPCGEAADPWKMQSSAFEDSEEDGFYRVTGAVNVAPSEIARYDAYASVLDYNGTAYYWSIVPARISEHYTDLWSNVQPASYVMDGLGGDAGLNLLASVKYVLAEEGDVVPAGYEETGLENGVLENRYALPIGYTFDSWMSTDDYEQLDAVEKRDVLLHAAVVELPVEGLGEIDYEPSVKDLNLFIQETWLEDGLTIRCLLPEESEVFVAVAAPEMFGSAASFDVVGPAGRNRAHVNDKNSNYAYPQRGVVIPMGVCGAGEAEFVFEMKSDSGFAIDGIALWYRPVGDYTAAAEKLKENVLENVEVGVNRVGGTIALEEAKWLQLSIPYSKGWSATVDGEAAELSESGGMYMGLLLEAGEHVVELEYRTPYMKEGVLVSALAVMLWAALSLAGGISRKKK